METDQLKVAQLIVLLSGKTGVGKTTVANELAKRLPAVLAQTSSMIMRIRPNSTKTRLGLQEAGNFLDTSTDFSWIAREALEVVKGNPNCAIVIDAVRVPRQVSKIRAVIPRHITQVHLTASRSEIIARFMARKRNIDDGLAYEAIESDISEKWDQDLAAISDLVVNTDYLTPAETAAAIIAFAMR